MKASSYVLGLIATLGLSACGGVLDYSSRPIQVHGEIIGEKTDGKIVLAIPSIGKSLENCAALISAGHATECRGQEAQADSSGKFEASFPGVMRGCPFLVIPPLLDAFCDRKSYLLVGIPGQAYDLYSLTISSKKAKVRRDSSAMDGSRVVVTNVEQVPNDMDKLSDKKDVISLQVYLK